MGREQRKHEMGRRSILRKQEAEVGGFGVIRIMAFCFLMRRMGHWALARMSKSGQMIQYTLSRKINWLVCTEVRYRTQGGTLF